MKRLVDYALSCVYMVYFGLVLVIFHGLQMLAFHLLGWRIHQKVVAWMNAFITFGWYLTGSRVRFRQDAPLPTNRPIIFVANHQSTFDIPPIIWFMRRHTPLFVSKIELAHGFPGVSYNLRKSGAALIDRNEPRQAIVEIARLGALIQEKNASAVIFPEGTRSPSGEMRPFVTGGVAMLLKRAPSALIVPITICGTGRFNPKGVFPLRSFSRIAWLVLAPIDPANRKPEEVVRLAQEAISAELDKQKPVAA